MARVDEDFPTPPFEGFAPDALGFFTELAARQDRAWMAEHKADYERLVRDPLAALVSAVSERLAAEGLPLRGDPRKGVFRIHRDTRFSADKRPYKTNGGAVWTPDGAKNTPGVLYFHLDPQGCFAAAGFHNPDADQLGRLRRGLVARPWAWAEMTAALAGAGLEIAPRESLSRLPKGFEDAPTDLHGALKLKSWVVMKPLEDGEILSPELVGGMLDFARAALPLLRLGWDALGR